MDEPVVEHEHWFLCASRIEVSVKEKQLDKLQKPMQFVKIVSFKNLISIITRTIRQHSILVREDEIISMQIENLSKIYLFRTRSSCTLSSFFRLEAFPIA